MRFFADDLSVQIPVEWYFVPNDRNHVPYGHPFGSRNWEDVPGPPILGEVPGTARYYGGDHSNDILGIGLCGTKDQWENGPSLLDKPRPLNPTTGRQCCCGRGVIQNEVSIVAGIETEVTEKSVITTCPTFNPMLDVWRVVGYDWSLQNNAPFWFNIPNTPVVQYSSGCRWNGPFGITPTGNPLIWLSYQLFPFVVLTAGTNIASWPSWFVYYPPAGWNPGGPNAMIKLYDSGAGIEPFPDELVIEPV